MPPKQAPPTPPPQQFDDSYERQLEAVLNNLQRIYHEHVRVVEQRFEYDTFHPSWFSDSVVQKKPFVTFLGPFSAGKSTFINYLMQSNYLLTGPQPVTDKFTVIMHGEEVNRISGQVLTSDPSQPFRGLQQFGSSFIECFEGVQAPHEILKSVSLIDTPGVLEAAGDIHARRYDYVKVCRWFIERSDLVFFLFDPTKLDAGVELRMLFKHALQGFENRTRIILNKADTVGPQELMRVYGSLFWNLSNLIKTTEPPRVYVSSFWDRPYKPGTNHKLFTDEKCDLLYDLVEVVPLQSLDKRVTHVMTRAKKVLIHMLVCATIRQAMPSLFGKDKAKADALKKLPETYSQLAAKHKLSDTDFPDPEEYKIFFNKVDLFALPDMDKCVKKQWIQNIQKTLHIDLPALLKPIKSTAVADPRDRKNRIMVQRDYQAKLQAQLEGQQGVQGGLGEMAPMQRAINVDVQQNQMFGQAPMQQQQQRQFQPPPPGLTPEQQMQWMQMQMQQQQQAPPPPPQQQQMDPQMMMMMMQMQQMQQQQQGGAAPVVQQQQPAHQPTPQANQMTPEMMQMMMMMQQQQQQQKQ